VLRAPEGQARRRHRVEPLSTGITFALTEKAPADKIPLITLGYGRSESQDGGVFKWNFPLMGSYWTGADIADPAHRQEGRRLDKLKGKKIALVYHDSPSARSPSRCCRSAPRCTASSCSCCR
jgi:branched-chain amino acid transport system substrate-binding protein